MNRVTLARAARLEVEVRKSRFLAQAAPVASPDEAMAFLSEVGDPAATHNCWAWRIHPAYRFSDDGEPASQLRGTSGYTARCNARPGRADPAPRRRHPRRPVTCASAAL